MTNPTTSVNVHLQSPEACFAPMVREFTTKSAEVLSLDLSTFVSVFLTRDRLHQLKDVLVEACGRWPK